MAKTYFGVTSVFDVCARLVRAYAITRCFGEYPRDTSYSRTKGVVFKNWFDTPEKAFQHIKDVRGEKHDDY
jgi:hypothetical protein